HPAACRLVAGLVPRADEATVLVDLAVREIGAQMPAAPRDGVALAVDVEHGPISDSPDRSGSKLLNGSNELLWHLAISPIGGGSSTLARLCADSQGGARRGAARRQQLRLPAENKCGG